MGLVDDIRRYVFYRYIKPAVDRGQKFIRLRAGDIHSEMRLNNRILTICTALGGKKSIGIFNSWLRKLGYLVEIRISEVKTPPSGQGANSYYTYSFVPIDEEAVERGKPIRTVGYSIERTSVNAHRRRSCEDVTEDNARRIIS